MEVYSVTYIDIFKHGSIRIPDGQEKFLAIGDLQGWGYSNSDVRGYLGFISVLQVKATIVMNIPKNYDHHIPIPNKNISKT